MGWLGGWFGEGDASDPLKKLDPKLREFLDKEAPTKYTPAADTEKAAPKPPAPPQPPVTKAPEKAATTAEAPPQDDKPRLPSASLYQDGRYAHLWKNYRPQYEIDAEGKSDNEKMMDLLEDYKARKEAIGRTALENCSDEQMDWASCMKDGTIGDRFVMCRDQVRKFERCYLVQSKLLKALGYLSSTTERTADNDERIQMHADMLFHRMLEREAAIEKAKEEGKPVPNFGPLVPAGQQSTTQSRAAAAAAAAAVVAAPPQTSAPATDDDPLAQWLGNADKRAKWDEKLAKLPPEEQRAEEAAMREELRANAQVKAKLDAMWEVRAKERHERLEKGQGTVTDRVAQLFGKA